MACHQIRQLSAFSLWVLFSIVVATLFAEGKNAPDDLVELQRLDPTITIKLPYATEENFCKVKLYPVERCFLRREVAEHLVAAHRSLAKWGVGLKVWDGYRPHPVQYMMWKVAPLPGFVGDPGPGSKHNRGAAVDVTLINLATGSELAMPTPFDDFSPRAESNYSELPLNVLGNRKLLQEVMREQGFTTISREWWHFDYEGWSDFPVEETPLETLAEHEDRE